MIESRGPKSRKLQIAVMMKLGLDGKASVAQSFLYRQP